jgi:hypothetical protein
MNREYIPITERWQAHSLSYRTGPFNFQIVHRFAYLGPKVNRKNDISAEIETAVSLQIYMGSISKHT